MKNMNKILSLASRMDVENIYSRHIGFMTNYAGQLTDNPEDRDDLIQDTLLRMMKHIDTLRVMESAKQITYIALTMKSIHINTQKHRHPERMVELTDELLLTVGEEDINRRTKTEVELLLEQLSAEDRMLLSGYYIAGWSMGELAQLLNCKESSIRMKLTRARKRAYRKFNGQGSGHRGK